MATPSKILKVAGTFGSYGEDGGYYSPKVTQTDDETAKVSFTPNKDGMPSVADQSIKLPAGPKGDKGDPGKDGADGFYVGTDEPTDENVTVWVNPDEAIETIEIPEIPETLPNPNSLTFTGAATGSYDGSAPMTVHIPEGGSGGGNSVSEYPDTPQFDFIVEEDCASILLDTLNDIPLSDYNFSTMYLIVNSSAVDTATSGVLQVRNNYELGSIRHPIASVNNFIRQTISRWWSVYFNHKEKINFWQTNATARDIDASTRTGQTYSYDNIYASVVLPITNVYINATEACQIPAGTRIIVWLK